MGFGDKGIHRSSHFRFLLSHLLFPAPLLLLSPHPSQTTLLLPPAPFLLSGFGVGYQRDTKTKGIWVWGEGDGDTPSIIFHCCYVSDGPSLTSAPLLPPLSPPSQVSAWATSGTPRPRAYGCGGSRWRWT